MLGVQPALSVTKKLRIISTIMITLVMNSGYGSLKKLCFRVHGDGEDGEDGDGEDGDGEDGVCVTVIVAAAVEVTAPMARA